MKKSDCWVEAYKLIANGDEKKAMEICAGELCSDILECQKYLGLMYYKQADMQQAANWYFQAAEKGDADALYGLASVRYVQGRFDEALQYFKDASNKGNARALHWVGFMYQKGYGASEDLDMAEEYYRKSASCGYLVAEHALIRLAFKKRSFLQILETTPKLFLVMFKAVVIAYKNADDERLSDLRTLGRLINSSKKRAMVHG